MSAKYEEEENEAFLAQERENGANNNNSAPGGAGTDVEMGEPLDDSDHIEAGSQSSDKNNLVPGLSQKDIRIGFVRKVYAIFSAQITITVGIAYYAMSNDAFGGYMKANPWLIFVALLSMCSVLCIFCCCPR
jgi:hypothetical protein